MYALTPTVLCLLFAVALWWRFGSRPSYEATGLFGPARFTAVVFAIVGLAVACIAWWYLDRFIDPSGVLPRRKNLVMFIVLVAVASKAIVMAFRAWRSASDPDPTQ
jgi:hypothetical protein